MMIQVRCFLVTGLAYIFCVLPFLCSIYSMVSTNHAALLPGEPIAEKQQKSTCLGLYLILIFYRS